jgi:lysyl-tRNA synthetase class I
MFIPMLEHQAGLFKKNGIHHNVIEKRLAFYDQIEDRIHDYQKKTTQDTFSPVKYSAPMSPISNVPSSSKM